jgi:hypothetical protein
LLLRTASRDATGDAYGPKHATKRGILLCPAPCFWNFDINGQDRLSSSSVARVALSGRAALLARGLGRSRATAASGAKLPVLRAKEGDAPVEPYRNRPKTPRLGEMCPRRGGRTSGVACAIVVRQGQGDHLSFEKANQRVRDAVFWLSMRLSRLFGGSKGDDEAQTYDATLGRGEGHRVPLASVIKLFAFG